MISKIKKILLHTPFAKSLLWLKYTHSIGLEGKLANPSSNKTKQLFIKKGGKNNKIFIETGTYLGDMVFANIDNFEKIYTIELDKKLFERAKKRFRNYSKVTVIRGDSAKVLRNLVSKIKKPTLFWLDAHYSGGITAKGKGNTPIEKELKIILKNWMYRNIIIIDDARLFTGSNGYPKIEAIKKMISVKKLTLSVSKDMILIN